MQEEERALLSPDDIGSEKQRALQARQLRLRLLQNAYLKAALALLACLAYMACSSWLILLNARLMKIYAFVYPLTLSSIGLIFSTVASFLCCRVFRVVEAKQRVPLKLFFRCDDVPYLGKRVQAPS